MIRVGLAACAIGLLLALVGCGGDKEPKPRFKGATPSESETAPSPTSTATQTAPAATQPPTTPTSPEEQPGGAGDEQPARVPAAFNGRGGQISPRSVHVPPYIAIRVELRSSDGRSYALRIAGALLRAAAGRRTDSATLSGLRPGKSLSGRPVGGGNPVRIVADAEPGP